MFFVDFALTSSHCEIDAALTLSALLLQYPTQIQLKKGMRTTSVAKGDLLDNSTVSVGGLQEEY